jgi:hypothetical protein
MAKQDINLGSGYDTLDGDLLRDGGQKINENFVEIYSRATEWVAGVYPQRTTVMYGNQLYFMSNTVGLPFTSSNFATEITNGYWILLDGSNFFDSWIVNKKPGNTNANVLEIGDIVRGYWDATEFWTEAKYLGGDVLQKSNYQIFKNYQNIS